MQEKKRQRQTQAPCNRVFKLEYILYFSQPESHVRLEFTGKTQDANLGLTYHMASALPFTAFIATSGASLKILNLIVYKVPFAM